MSYGIAGRPTPRRERRGVGRSVLLAAVLLPAILAVTPAGAQPKGEPPHVLCSLPVGLRAGTTARFTARGLRLDTATEVRFHEPKTFGSIKTRGPAQAPNPQDVPRTGNTQADIEVKLSPDLGGRFIPFSFVGPGGPGGSVRVFVLDEQTRIVPEKEPNNGFREAQSVPLTPGTPAAVQGVITHPHDVDVFRVEGRAGHLLRAEVIARRCGSPLDSLLTLYSESGEEVVSNDDHAGSTDSRLSARLSASGVYYVAVADSLDLGGPSYAYSLLLGLDP